MVDRILRVSKGLAVIAWLVFATHPATAQSSSAQRAGNEPAFEVATIKPAAPSPDGHTHINYPAGDELSAANITVAALMEWAYAVPRQRILDGPAWLGSTRFDIHAKLDPENIRGLSSEQERALKRRMVQTLLAQRFSLKLHQETRVLPAYDLVLAKGGSKLELTKSKGWSSNRSDNSLRDEGMTMSLIAEQLSQIAGRIVVDKTGLNERYDLKLQWARDDEPATEKSAPSLFTAVQEQLGLKLESAKEPVPVLAVDHIEEPSAN